MKTVKKKTTKKTSVLQFDKNIIKSSTARELCKNISSEDKEFHEVNSLVFLNDTKERKKINGIHERINFLKTELNSLLVDLKTDKTSDYCTDNSNLYSYVPLHSNMRNDLESDVRPVENTKLFKKTSVYKNEFQPNSNSTPTKFSEWLGKTVEKLERKSEIEKSNKNELLNSVLQMDLAPETFLTNSFATDFNSFNTSVLSQQKVEQLLYKSFLIQNYNAYLSTSAASGLEQNESIRRKKQLYNKSRSGKKFNKRGSVQRNVSICRSLSQCEVKQRKINSSNSPKDVEIITLDCSSSVNTLPGADVECVDLDLSTYDWSEPFVMNEVTDHSDIQIIEGGGEKNVTNYKELMLNNSELLESDISTGFDESKKPKPKKVWECPVCFERSKGQEIVATQCGHVFCRKCIEKHISKLNNNCPSCRCDLKNKPFITLFNF